MVTNVGTQTNFFDAIKELIELDYDALDAYDAAIKNLEKQEYKNKLREFRSHHQRHVDELTDFLTRAGEKAPSGPDLTKNLLVKGKVHLASMFGDKDILSAMLSNEEDLNTAYTRMKERAPEANSEDVLDIVTRGAEDEKQHKEWLIIAKQE